MHKYLTLSRNIALVAIFLLFVAFLSGCRNNPTPERTVMRNLHRQFPDGNFEAIGFTGRRVPGFPYFHFDFQRTVYDVHIIRCLDYDITFTTLDGRENAYLARLYAHHLTLWNDQLAYDLYQILSDGLEDISDPRATVSFHRELGYRSVLHTSSVIQSLPDAHIWLRHITTHHEGLSRFASESSVNGAFIDLSYNITLSDIDPHQELARIQHMLQAFASPLHTIIGEPNQHIITRLRINFIKQIENNDQDIHLARFEWVHDNLVDAPLSQQTPADLYDYLTQATIHDELNDLMNETMCFEGHALVGSWGNLSAPFRQYHFYADGTGRGYTLSTAAPGTAWANANQADIPFVWRITDDDYLLIIFDGEATWTQAHSNVRLNDITLQRTHTIHMPLTLSESELRLTYPAS